MANKEDTTRVLLVDDASVDFDAGALAKEFGVEFTKPKKRLGVGVAQKYAFTQFLSDGADFICSLPNDVLVAKHFETRTLDLHLKHAGENGFTSGYRSTKHRVIRQHEDHVIVTSSGGVGLVLSRAGVQMMINTFPAPWGMRYDFEYRNIFEKIVNPVRSLIEHVGARSGDEHTIHKESTDIAVGFVGEGM